ncbi:sulfurtransferase [Novosphingobium aquimarinum]|uniref:sulfurtransferase n=1 Tax=Novosphingobium aquimarinum TaxID=2682494 RepID=UPI0012EC70EB|nr:sulfurtransferase [Novosphingobium aquimarinum]
MTWTTIVSPAELAEALGDGGNLIADCSFDLGDTEAGRRAYAEAHLPGAVYLHLDDDLSGTPDGGNGRHPLPDRAALAALLRELGLSHDTQVVAYDRSGGFYAARLWWELRWLGHEAVAVLDGGFAAWSAAGFAIESGTAPTPAAGDFVARASLEPEPASADEILADVPGKDLLVVDARDAARFRGETHALDTASGHIPGAANRFFRENLDAEGKLLPASDLQSAFAPLLARADGRTLVSQCGSGVTACHNLLALRHAGIEGARLYPGSWSEWTSDPSRPIATGED